MADPIVQIKMTDALYARIVRKINKAMTGETGDEFFFQTYFEYAGTPDGNVSSRKKGDICLDTTNNVVYCAEGEGATDWTQIAPI